MTTISEKLTRLETSMNNMRSTMNMSETSSIEEVETQVLNNKNGLEEQATEIQNLNNIITEKDEEIANLNTRIEELEGGTTPEEPEEISVSVSNEMSVLTTTTPTFSRNDQGYITCSIEEVMNPSGEDRLFLITVPQGDTNVIIYEDVVSAYSNISVSNIYGSVPIVDRIVLREELYEEPVEPEEPSTSSKYRLTDEVIPSRTPLEPGTVFGFKSLGTEGIHQDGLFNLIKDRKYPLLGIMGQANDTSTLLQVIQTFSEQDGTEVLILGPCNNHGDYEIFDGENFADYGDIYLYGIRNDDDTIRDIDPDLHFTGRDVTGDIFFKMINDSLEVSYHMNDIFPELAEVLKVYYAEEVPTEQ